MKNFALLLKELEASPNKRNHFVGKVVADARFDTGKLHVPLCALAILRAWPDCLPQIAALVSVPKWPPVERWQRG